MRFALAFAAIFVHAALPPQVAAESPPPSNEIGLRVKVLICSDLQPSNQPNWRPHFVHSLLRPLAEPGKRVAFQIREDDCTRGPTAAFQFSMCYAGPELLICKRAGLVRLFRAAIFLARQLVRETSGDYELLTKRKISIAYDALLFGDGKITSEEDERLVETFRMAAPEELRFRRRNMALASDTDVATIAALITDAVLTALTGHEVSHINQEKCPLTEPSRLERSGLTRLLLSDQLEGRLFARRNPALIEVRADICALRHLERLDRYLDSRLVEPFSESVRRASADLVALLLLTAWSPLNEQRPEAARFVDVPGYFYPSFRVLLFAGALAQPRAKPQICGYAAQLWVRATELAARSNPGTVGHVTDEMLALVSPRIENAWNGKEKWSRAVFTCR